MAEAGQAVINMLSNIRQRAPGKRQIKPSLDTAALEAFASQLAGDDSEDDEDFVANVSGDNSDVASSESEAANEDEENEDNDDEEEAESGQGDVEEESLFAASGSLVLSESLPKPTVSLLCAICLKSNSSDDNELLQCDSCAVAVHETCCGVTDAASLDSGASSTSTEPWFCDPCKSGLMSPSCLLCPNLGGVFKETVDGGWVHLLCALYIHEVKFGDLDALLVADLTELPAARWQQKQRCACCSDPRLAASGVLISCEAGLCRENFHATCAQREGLLAELQHDSEVDPFYCYCRQHSDSDVIRQRKQLYHRTQTSRKNFSTDVPAERLERKRAAALVLYGQALARVERAQSQLLYPRPLTGCPLALRQLLAKSAHFGVAPMADDPEERGRSGPAFTAAFVAYYMTRQQRMSELTEEAARLEQLNESLQAEERQLKVTYARLHVVLRSLQDQGDESASQGRQLTAPLGLPELAAVFAPAVRVPLPGGQQLTECATCRQVDNQHLLIDCDDCSLHFHCYCLDPPQSRVPKKTKLWGWQCAKCCPSSSDSEVLDESVDIDGPRQLREKKVKPLDGDTPETSITGTEATKTKPVEQTPTKRGPRGKKRPKTKDSIETQETVETSIPKKAATPSWRAKRASNVAKFTAAKTPVGAALLEQITEMMPPAGTPPRTKTSRSRPKKVADTADPSPLPQQNGVKRKMKSEVRTPPQSSRNNKTKLVTANEVKGKRRASGSAAPTVGLSSDDDNESLVTVTLPLPRFSVGSRKKREYEFDNGPLTSSHKHQPKSKPTDTAKERSPRASYNGSEADNALSILSKLGKATSIKPQIVQPSEISDTFESENHLMSGSAKNSSVLAWLENGLQEQGTKGEKPLSPPGGTNGSAAGSRKRNPSVSFEDALSSAPQPKIPKMLETPATKSTVSSVSDVPSVVSPSYIAPSVVDEELELD